MSDFCLFQIREVGCQKISIFERRYFLFLNFICGPKYNTKPSQTSTYLDISYRYTVMEKHQYIVNDIYTSTHTYNIKYPRLTPTEYLLVIFVLMRRVESDPSEQIHDNTNTRGPLLLLPGLLCIITWWWWWWWWAIMFPRWDGWRGLWCQLVNVWSDLRYCKDRSRSLVYEFEEGCLLRLVMPSSKSFFNRLFLRFCKAEIISLRD